MSTDESSTEDPATEAGPTALCDAIEETEAHTAWSLVEEEPEPRWWTPDRITAAAVAAAVVASGVAVAIAIPHLSQPTLGDVAMTTPSFEAEDPQLPPVGESGFEIPPPPPPAPSTVTVTAEAEPAPVVRDGPSVEDYDQIFLSRLRAQNWVIWDERSITMNGHRVCALLQQGASVGQVQTDLVQQRVYPPNEASSFVATARGTYPGCV